MEQKSRFVERETKRLEPSRKDWDMVHDELAVREAALAEDVATSKTQMIWWRAQTPALELPWTLTLDLKKRQDSRCAARVGRGINVPLELLAFHVLVKKGQGLRG